MSDETATYVPAEKPPKKVRDWNAIWKLVAFTLVGWCIGFVFGASMNEPHFIIPAVIEMGEKGMEGIKFPCQKLVTQEEAVRMAVNRADGIVARSRAAKVKDNPGDFLNTGTKGAK